MRNVLRYTALPQAVDRSHSAPPPALAAGPSDRRGSSTYVLAVAAATWLEALRYDGFCCPADHRYRYGLLRLPLGAPPLPGASGYRLRRSRAPQAGKLGPQTPGPRRISPVQRWAVWSFRSHYAGGFLGAAAPSSSHRPWPSPSRSGLGSRSFLPSQACLRRVHRLPHRTDRPLARRPRRLCHGASTLGSPLAPATSYGAAWPLPRPDFHRRVHRRLQDTHRDSKFSMKEGLVVNCVVVGFRHHLRVALAGAGVELCVG